MVKGNKDLDWGSILNELDNGEYGIDEDTEKVLKEYNELEDLGDEEGFEIELTQSDIDEIGEVYDEFERDRVDEEEEYIFGTIDDELDYEFDYEE